MRGRSMFKANLWMNLDRLSKFNPERTVTVSLLYHDELIGQIASDVVIQVTREINSMQPEHRPDPMEENR